jgi:hypothetical protein
MSTSPPLPPAPGKHFTAFGPEADQAAPRSGEDGWDNEGGHMSSTAGRIVHAPGTGLPYKVVMSHDGGVETERAFATMHDAEAFIRRNTPVPAARRTLYDRAAEEGVSSKFSGKVIL